jgi:hypothetical protein
MDREKNYKKNHSPEKATDERSREKEGENDDRSLQ